MASSIVGDLVGERVVVRIACGRVAGRDQEDAAVDAVRVLVLEGAVADVAEPAEPVEVALVARARRRASTVVGESRTQPLGAESGL